MNKWQIGHETCKNGIILLIENDSNKIHIYPGEGTRKMMNKIFLNQVYE
jgi:uncharacterized membrane protein YgcG